jgi:symplekin
MFNRHDLALEWLHEEYLLDKRYQRLDPNTYTPSYFQWFHRLLEKGIPTLDAKDRILTKLLLDAPELDAKVIDLIKQNLESVPERFVPCVSTLRSLVTNRPTVRFLALQVLLDLCKHTNDKMRRTSIVAVKKWNLNQLEINEKVESFAVEALHTLVQLKQDQSTDVTMDEASQEEQDAESKEDAKDAWIKLEVVRHAELYFVLCTKRPTLLKE